jgi:hypothetical protein
MFAETLVSLIQVVEFTVIPGPEIEAAAPLKKFVPSIATLVVTPWGLWSGTTPVTVGAAPVTVNVHEHVAGPPSPLTMLIAQLPGATSVMSKSIDNDVDELRVQFVPGMGGCPLIVSVAVPVVSKLVPVSVNVTGALFATELGAELRIVGFALIVKHAAQLPDPPSGLWTVMFPAPTVAPDVTLITMSISPLNTNVVDATETPEFEKDTVAPFWKFAPVIATGLFVAP